MSAARTSRTRRLAGHRPPGAVGRAREAAGEPASRVETDVTVDGVAVDTAPDPSADPTGAVGSAQPDAATGASAPEPIAPQPIAPSEPVEEVVAAGRSRRLRPSTLVLAVLVVAAAIGLGLLGRDLLAMQDRAQAGKSGQVVAADSLERILSYDHATYAKDVAGSKELMTDGFAEEYARTVESVRAEVLRTESKVEADVVASSVVRASEDEVRALVFVNQTTTGKQVQEPRVDLNRVIVTLHRADDGSWLVADLDAL